MSVRSEGKAIRKWTTQKVLTTDPPITSPAHLVLLARKYTALDTTIYKDTRMYRVREKWMKLQMKTPDAKGGLTCVVCGRQGLDPFTKDIKTMATIDHVVELKDGGAWRDPSNFRITCFYCNNKRNRLQYQKKPKLDFHPK